MKRSTMVRFSSELCWNVCGYSTIYSLFIKLLCHTIVFDDYVSILMLSGKAGMSMVEHIKDRMLVIMIVN